MKTGAASSRACEPPPAVRGSTTSATAITAQWCVTRERDRLLRCRSHQHGICQPARAATPRNHETRSGAAMWQAHRLRRSRCEIDIGAANDRATEALWLRVEREAEGLQTAIQVAPVHFEQAGRGRYVAAALPQRFAKQRALIVVEQLAVALLTKHGCRRGGRPGGQQLAQLVLVDDQRPWADNQGAALDEVAQLAHI